MEKTKRKVNLVQLFSFALLGLLTIEVVLLIKQNNELRAALGGQAAIDPLKSGEEVEPIKIRTLDGNFSELNYKDPSREYLLFILSTTCPHCESNLPIWGKINAGKKNANCDVLGVSIHGLEDTKQYAASKNVPFYLVSVAEDTSFHRKYKIAGVPETILITGTGRVKKAWFGELSSEQASEIQALMGVQESLAN